RGSRGLLPLADSFRQTGTTAPRTAMAAFHRLVCISGIWLAVGVARAQQPTLPPPRPVPAPAVAPAPVITRYTLGDALTIAHARHPQLAALRESVSAALLKQRGAGEVKRTAGIITPDIDIRLQQSDLGIRADMA